jgi:hypothetical protein
VGQLASVRFWWVNHKQTVRQEVEGGYLWSPKRTSGNARNQFYDNMRGTARGDAVLSFANGRIGHVGLVTGEALSEGKPRSFGTIGHQWSDDGWWLPVDWAPLSRPFVPQARIAEIRKWLPYRYSPINPATGKGNQGAYLAEIPEDLFRFVIDDSGAGGWTGQFPDEQELDESDYVAASRLGYETALTASVREQVIKARRGQGLFRFRVFQIENVCRLTGIANPDLLIASHIKPWRLCETTDERLDGANGLLLTPHVDRLFDKGLITFSDSGEVLRSPTLPRDDLRRLGLEEACRRNAGGFSTQQQNYLEHHRRSVFERNLR